MSEMEFYYEMCEYCTMSIHDSFTGLYRVENTWIEVQKQTFTNWLNFTLGSSSEPVQDIYTDLNDGIVLITLFKQLTSRAIERYNCSPDVNSKKLENLTIAIHAFEREGVPLINIGPADVFYGNKKLILGLLWHIILHYHVGTYLPLRSSRTTNRSSSVSSLSADEMPQNETKHKNEVCKRSYTKEMLLQWIKNVLPDHSVTNLTTHWQDGNVLCHLLNAVVPGCVPEYVLNSQCAEIKLEFSLLFAQNSLNIPILLDATDIARGRADEFSILTYLCYFTKSGGVAEKWCLDQLKATHPKVYELVQNMTSSWTDGVALSILLDECIYLQFPDVPKCETRRIRTIKETFQKANELFGFKSIISPIEFCSENVSPICFISYISNFISLTNKLITLSKHIDVDLVIQVHERFSTHQACRFSVTSSSFTSQLVFDDVDVNVIQTPRDSVDSSTTFEDVPVIKVASSEKAVDYEFLCIEDHTYTINVYYRGKPVLETPTVYHSPRLLSQNPLRKEEIYLITSCQTPSVVNNEVEFEINIPEGHNLLSAHYTCDKNFCSTSKQYKCTVAKVTTTSYKISAHIQTVGTYYLVLEIDNQVISIPETAVKVGDPSKVRLIHTSGTTLECGKSYIIEVDADNAGEGTLTCEVQLNEKPGTQSSCETLSRIESVEIIKKGPNVFNVVIPTIKNLVMQYSASIYWNGVLSSTVIFDAYDPNRLFFSAIRQNQPVVANQSSKLNIVTAGLGKIEKLEAFLENDDDSAVRIMVDLELASIDFYKGVFILSSSGSYSLKAYINSSLVVLPYSIECVDLSKITVEYFQSTIRVGEEFKIKVFIPHSAGKGDIASLLIGQQGPLKMMVADVTHTEDRKVYTLVYNPHICGSHMISITYAGYDIPNFPQRVDVDDIDELDDDEIVIDLKTVSPTVYKSISCFKIFAKIRGNVNGIFTGWVESYDEKRVIESQQVDFQICENGTEEMALEQGVQSIIGQYEVTSKYPKKLHIYRGSKPIPQSPFNVMVIDVNNIKINPTLLSSERFFVNNTHRFEIYCDQSLLHDGPISCFIEGPDGPLEISLKSVKENQSFYSEQVLNKTIGSSESEKDPCSTISSNYVVKFTPKTCGVHILTVAYCGMYVKGFPFTFNVEKLTRETASKMVLLYTDELQDIFVPSDVILRADVKRSTLVAELSASLHPKSHKFLKKSEEIKFVKSKSRTSLDWNYYLSTLSLTNKTYDSLSLKLNSVELLESPYKLYFGDELRLIKIKHPCGGMSFAPLKVTAWLPKQMDIKLLSMSLQHLTQKSYRIAPENMLEVAKMDLPCSTDGSSIPPSKICYRTYEFDFLPSKAGLYDLSVSYSGNLIPKFPQKIEIVCDEFCDPTKVCVDTTGFNNMLCDRLQNVTIDAEDAGTGVLAVRLYDIHREVIPTKINCDSNESKVYVVSFKIPFCGDYTLEVYWSATLVPGSPFPILAVRPYKTLKLRSDCIPDGFINEVTNVYLDCKNGEKIDELCCRCIQPDTKEIIKTSIEHVKGSESETFVFKLMPHIPGDFRFEVQVNCQPLGESPFPYHVSLRPTPSEDKISVYGPGLSPGCAGRHDGFFWVRMGEGTGSGILRVSITGFENSFDLFPHFGPSGKTGLHREVMFVFDPTESGEYLICVYWNGEHVGQSPFKIKISEPAPQTLRSTPSNTIH